MNGPWWRVPTQPRTSERPVPSRAMDVVGIVLGAGRSTRLVRPKQTLPFGATTVLGHVASGALDTDHHAQDVHPHHAVEVGEVVLEEGLERPPRDTPPRDQGLRQGDSVAGMEVVETEYRGQVPVDGGFGTTA